MRKPKPFTIPTMESAHPPLNDLQMRKVELDSRAREIEHDISRLRRGKAPVSAIAAASAERQARAAELVGDLVDTSGAAPRVRVDMDAIRYEMQAELDSMHAALALIERELVKAKGTAASAVVDRVRPEYERAVQDLAGAVAVAIEAHDRMTRITLEMTRDGTPWLGRLPQPASLRSVFGEFGEDDTRAKAFLKDVRAAGLWEDRNV